jgi:hypothetical protein
MLPVEDRRARVEDARSETPTGADFFRLDTREGAPLGRNRFVESEIKKPKPNGASVRVSPHQKPCEKMTEAIVADGPDGRCKRPDFVNYPEAFYSPSVLNF